MKYVETCYWLKNDFTIDINIVKEMKLIYNGSKDQIVREMGVTGGEIMKDNDLFDDFILSNIA